MSDRKKILDRIRQLREKTASRGCTEAEAMSAAAKAAELMAKHGLSDDDVVMEDASSILAGQRHAMLSKLWVVIAYCTNTAALRVSKGKADGMLFIGQTPGPEIAVYLRDICDRAVKRELADFKSGAFYKRRRNMATRRAAIADFLDGLIQRLSRRLAEFFGPSISAEARQIAVDARDSRFPDATSVALKTRQTRFSKAEHEGWKAGGRPQLTHGVGGAAGGPAGLIGRTS